MGGFATLPESSDSACEVYLSSTLGMGFCFILFYFFENAFLLHNKDQGCFSHISLELCFHATF